MAVVEASSGDDDAAATTAAGGSTFRQTPAYTGCPIKNASTLKSHRFFALYHFLMRFEGG